MIVRRYTIELTVCTKEFTVTALKVALARHGLVPPVHREVLYEQNLPTFSNLYMLNILLYL